MFEYDDTKCYYEEIKNIELNKKNNRSFEPAVYINIIEINNNYYLSILIKLIFKYFEK